MNKRSLEKLNDWKQHTWKGLLLTTVVELALTYGFASWSIDSGSLVLYAVTLLFLIGAIRNLVKLIKVLINGQPKTSGSRRTKK